MNEGTTPSENTNPNATAPSGRFNAPPKIRRTTCTNTCQMLVRCVDVCNLMPTDPDIKVKTVVEHDLVSHPKHYTSEAKCSSCGESIEYIDIVRHMGFNQGNVMKYLWRAGKKDSTVQDLKKAIWYIEDLISDIEAREKPKE